MKLLKFLDFIKEASSDILLPFVASSEFEQKLDEIDSAIASKLIGVIRIRQLSKVTLVTVSEDGNIEYSDSYRVDEFKKKQQENDNYPTSNWLKSFTPDPSDEIYSYRRVNIGVGRFINRIFPNEFTSAEVEDFVNKWRAVNQTQPTFELWSGYEILDGYRSTNYHYTETNMNTLMNSCMNDQLDCVEMYRYCSDLRLLVLFDSENNILGRALIWKDHQGRYIMDRVYYVYDSDYHKFVNYAKKNGWFYKKRNISGGSSFVKGDREFSFKTKVRVPDVFEMEENGDKFPYMDTFCYVQDSWAYNNPPDDGRYLKLTDTEGGYEIFSGMYDIHGQEILDERDYILSEEQGGYIWRDDAVNVEYDGGHGFENYSYDDWVEKVFLENPRNGFIKVSDNWYKQKHCVWSEKEQSWIWRPEAVYVKGDWLSWDKFHPGAK